MVVLLAEDDSATRLLFRQILEAAGYIVLAAEDGAEALRQSRAFPGEIHLLLSDLNMPHLMGSDLAAALSKERPGIRILIMTGNSTEIPVIWIPHMLEKPVPIGALLSRMARELGGAHAAQRRMIRTRSAQVLIPMCDASGLKIFHSGDNLR